MIVLLLVDSPNSQDIDTCVYWEVVDDTQARRSTSIVWGVCNLILSCISHSHMYGEICIQMLVQ